MPWVVRKTSPPRSSAGVAKYVLAVKENQPHLYEDIERAFDEALDQGEPGVDFTECQTEGPRKGRQEMRVAV